MRAAAVLAVALVSAGCGGEDARIDPTALDARAVYPAWLDGEYADGKLRLRYPDWWRQGSSDTLGRLLSDNRSRHPAFVSVRYLEAPPSNGAAYAELAARTLRPPRGRGLTLLYVQAAWLGGRRGVEATFVWQTKADAPAGPRFRTFGVPLPSRRVAFLVFAAERPRLHAGAFGWILRSIRWDGPAIDRIPGGRHVNEP